MTPNPIRKVLSTLRTNRVRFLLMGGQACVLYGATEFSRDTDIVLLADEANCDRLARALRDLDAECIAVPPFEPRYLRKGHAIHFRCRAPEAAGTRLDVMSVLRGVAGFATLWRRRTTVDVGQRDRYDLLSLPDLVQAKKTQRDKDWLMLRRLVEAHYYQHRPSPSREQVTFWFQELRSIPLLRELARKYPRELRRAWRNRPLLSLIARGSEAAVAQALAAEEDAERAADRVYWAPLRKELEALRWERTRRGRG